MQKFEYDIDLKKDAKIECKSTRIISDAIKVRVINKLDFIAKLGVIR